MVDDERHSVGPGKCPEFGAIFMASSVTKKECFRTGVFALPKSKSHFVEQVKNGMILFLFDFERRELHGVFQATCDGAMNILPCEFSSLYRQFPAQVKFAPLWNCHPLSENDFRGAIRENYFSKYRFHFGLSKSQVERLLSLFSFRKVKDQTPQKKLTRIKVPSPNRNSTRKVGRKVGDDRLPMSNLLPGECDMDKNHRQVISPQRQRAPFCVEDRATGYGRFGMDMDEGYEHKASESFWDCMGKVGCTTDADQGGSEQNNGINLRASASVGYPLGNFGSISDSFRSARNDRLQTDCYKDDGRTISDAYPFQFMVNPLAYSSKPALETDIHDPSRLSLSVLSTEHQSSNVPRTSCEDSTITSTLPYNPDALSMNYNSFSSLGLHHPSFPEFSRHDNSAAGNTLHSPKAQPFSSPLETGGAIMIPDVNFGLPNSNQYEHSNQTSLPRHPYLDDIASAYSKEGCSENLSLQKPLAHFSSEKRNYVMSGHPLSIGGSPCNHWSHNISERHPTLLQEKYNYQVPECANNTEFSDGALIYKESQHLGESLYNYESGTEDGRLASYEIVKYGHTKSQLQQLYGHEPANWDYLTPSNPAAYQDSECLNPGHQITSVNPAAYRNSESLNPEREKKRSSVFSRLALPCKASKKERKTAPATTAIKENSSVNDVMDMLHHSQYSWMTTSSKQSSKQHEKAANSRDRKHATKKDDLGKSEADINLKLLPFSMVKGCQRAKEASFVDFKRRSLMRKNFEEGKAGNSESLDNKGASAPQTKRRKLIRPNFFDNGLPERVFPGDAPQAVITCSRECSVSKDGESIKVSASPLKEGDILPKVESLYGICHSAVKGNKNIDESRECSIIKDAESIKVFRRLIRPNFFENELPKRVLSGDVSRTVIASSIECSVSKDNEIMKVVSHAKEGDTLQNVESLDGFRQTTVEGSNYIDESRECFSSIAAESINFSASLEKKGYKLQNVKLLNGIGHTAVEGNNINESGECSVSKDAESIKVSASHAKEGDMLQNVGSLDGICQTSVEGSNYIDDSRQCAVLKDAERINVSASHVKKSDKLQNFELLSGISQSAVDDNNIDESGECSVSKDAESSKVSAFHVTKDDKLQNVESFNEIFLVAVEGNNNIDESRECSISKDAESIKVSVSQNNKLQNAELPNGVCQIDLEGNNNIDKGNDSSSEQFRMDSSSIAVRCMEEGRKESSQNCGIGSMTKIEPDLSTGNVRVDGSSEDRDSTPGRSPKICEVVDGNSVAKSKCLYKIEPINDLCSAGGEISISNVK